MLRAPARIARVGIYDYRLGDGTLRRELRLPEDVFHADSLDSFALVPVTMGHPSTVDGVTADNAHTLSVGHLGDSVRRDGDFVGANMLLSDPSAIAAVEAGRTQVSAGYYCDCDETPGEWQGQKYDAVQRNIRGNHIAIVDQGRAGPEVRIQLDAADGIVEDAQWSAAHMNDLPDSAFLYIESGGEKDKEGRTTPRSLRHFPVRGPDGKVDLPHLRNALARIPQSSLPAAVKEKAKAKAEALLEKSKRGDAMTVEELEAKASEQKAKRREAEARADAAEKKVAEATARADAAEKKLAEVTARADAAEKARADAVDPKRLDAAVAVRVALLDQARSILGSGFSGAGQDESAIRLAVVQKIDPEFKVDGKDPAYLPAYFDALLRLRPATPVVRVDAAGNVEGHPAPKDHRAMYLDAVMHACENSVAAFAAKK